MATTALLSYNVYKAYINPHATGKQLLRFSEYAAVAFAIVAAAIAVGLNHAGFSVGFLITAIGIFVDSAIIPMACTIMWKKQSKAAVLISPLASSAAGLIAWFLKAQQEYGTITITTLSGNLPLVAGNMMALCGPIVLTPLITYLKPEDFDWNLLKTEIKRGDDEHVITENPSSTEDSVESARSSLESHAERTEKILLQARRKAIIASITLTLILLIVWPIPMYASGYVFSKGFFTGWTVVVFLWAFFAALVITLLPIWEARKSLAMLAAYILRGGSKSSKHAKTLNGVVVESRNESRVAVEAKTADQKEQET